MSIKENLLLCFKGVSFTLKEAYEKNPEVNRDSVRARIYENLGIAFEKIDRGIYATKDADCLLIEGNGRNLSNLHDKSVDCIITDYPWSDKKSNKGGSRNFATYDVFQYEQEDFNEKARVLKDGSFLCEILPAENENNYETLYEIKQMAKKAGFEYYAKVSWKKGTFVSNTGRKAKNTEDVMIFSKGKARNLRIDAKKTKNTGEECFMSGTNKMLPTEFDAQPAHVKSKICQAEKPVELYEQILEHLTKEGEIVLDQFCGSGNLGLACMNKSRFAILIEKKQRANYKDSEKLVSSELLMRICNLNLSVGYFPTLF